MNTTIWSNNLNSIQIPNYLSHPGHVSHVTCQVSPITCHLSHVKKKLSFKKIGQSGGVRRGRVCYQWGLPRLVFFHEHTQFIAGCVSFPTKHLQHYTVISLQPLEGSGLFSSKGHGNCP